MLTPRRCFRLLAITILSIVPPALHAVSVPLKDLGGDLIAAPVEIAGVRLRMLIDTGTTRSLVRPVVAQRLHLIPRARFVLQTPTARRDAVCAGPVKAKIGGFALTIACLGWSSAIDRLHLGSSVDGILAADALVGLPIRIDLSRRMLIVGPGALSVTGKEVPLEVVEGRPVVDVPAGGILARVGSLRLVLDSAANQLVLFGGAAQALARRQVGWSTLNGESRVAIAMAPRIQGLSRRVRRAVLLPQVRDRRENGLVPLTLVGSVALDWGRGVAILDAHEADALAALRPTGR